MLKKSIALKPKVGIRRPGPGPKSASQGASRPSTEETSSKTPTEALPATQPEASAQPQNAPHPTSSAPLDVGTPVSGGDESGDGQEPSLPQEKVDKPGLGPPDRASTGEATAPKPEVNAAGGTAVGSLSTTAPHIELAASAQTENQSAQGTPTVEEPVTLESPAIVSPGTPAASSRPAEVTSSTTTETTETGPAAEDQPDQASTPPATDAPVVQPQTASTPAAEPSPTPSQAPRQTRGRKRTADATTGGDAGAQSGTGSATKRPRKRAAALPGEEGYEERRVAEKATRPKRSRRTTGNGDAGEDGQGTTRQRPRRTTRQQREATPPDAENVQIDVTQVKMADLVKDMHIGKKFSLHDELMERERARRMRYGGRKRRQQQDGDDANNEDAQPTTGSTPSSATPAATATEAAASNPDTPGSPPARAGPPLSERYQLINGEIVLDPSSLIVDRHARAREEAATMQEVEENDFTYRVTSSTYLRRNLKPQQWTDEETERFYQALAAFGTDFDTICRMFRGKTRKHIKLKFNREERVNPARINAALVGQKTVAMDLDEYQAHTGNQYETAEAIYAEQKRAQDEFEARQKALDDEKADEARRKKEEAMKQLEVSLAKERGDAGTKRRGRKSKKDQEA